MGFISQLTGYQAKARVYPPQPWDGIFSVSKDKVVRDHIIPLKLFRGVAADHDILRSGWALSNLRPLRCGLNKTKSARRLLLL